MPEAARPKIAILGAGLSGMCMGIALRRAGIHSFTIFEKADRVGGTWRENSYPGVACDVPSHLYSYSFELNPSWSRLFSPGAEIQAYCERVADKYGLAPHLCFGSEVVGAEFEDPQWRVRLASGEEERFDVVVSALGGLHHPSIPELPGLDRFEGVQFHSARWQHDHDLTGRRVAVIGSAASAVQIVPEIAQRAEQLYVFQRTPNWILPRHDYAYGSVARALFAHVPGLARLYRLVLYGLLEVRFPAFRKGSRLTGLLRRACTRYIEREISDPELRRQLTPEYPPGCKRLLISDDFYTTLARDDVEVVTEGIASVDAKGIRTHDGVHRPIDTLIFATGFHPFSILSRLEVRGQEGLSLSDAWKGGVRAHRTVAVPGFPSFFLLLGPNSGLGHNSVIVMIEAQVRYVLQCIRALQARGLAYLSPRAQAAGLFDRELEARLQGTIWHGLCQSWYQDARGRVYTLWPRTTLRYLWDMRRPRLDEYEQVEAK